MGLTDETIDEFFRRVLVEALHDQHVRVSDDAERYLIQVLVRRATHGQEADTDITEPLTPRFLRAHDAETSDAERIRLLRSVGDDAILLCGLFWQRLWRAFRQYISASERIAIGKAAYRELDVPFPELADRFHDIIYALIPAGERLFQDATRIIALVQRWEMTHDPHVADMLRHHGIIVEELSHTKAPS